MFAAAQPNASITVEQLCQRLQLEFTGDGARAISGVSSLQNAAGDDLCFIRGDKYRAQLEQSACGACIVPLGFEAKNLDKTLLYSDNPHRDFVHVINALKLYRGDMPAAQIHSSAIIDESAQIAASAAIGANCVIGERVRIGEQVQIGAGCVIEDDVEIGDHSKLLSNVTVCFGSVLGKEVVLQPGVVIGGDGFGLVWDDGQWMRIPHLGKVRLGDRAEVGANTTIDRGALDDTVIGQGVKIDNQIQIGHNVVIGDNTAIAASAAIAGSAVIGKNCKISGCAGIVGHINITDDVTITAMSMVTHSIKQSGVYSSGTPLMENSQWRRNTVRFKSLDKLARSVSRLKT